MGIVIPFPEYRKFPSYRSVIISSNTIIEESLKLEMAWVSLICDIMNAQTRLFRVSSFWG